MTTQTCLSTANQSRSSKDFQRSTKSFLFQLSCVRRCWLARICWPCIAIKSRVGSSIDVHVIDANNVPVRRSRLSRSGAPMGRQSSQLGFRRFAQDRGRVERTLRDLDQDARRTSTTRDRGRCVHTDDRRRRRDQRLDDIRWQIPAIDPRREVEQVRWAAFIRRLSTCNRHRSLT